MKPLLKKFRGKKKSKGQQPGLTNVIELYSNHRHLATEANLS